VAPRLEHSRRASYTTRNSIYHPWWRWAAGLTAGFILLGLATFAIRGGVNYSIEFTGGTLMQIQFTKSADAGKIRETLDRAGIRGAEIQQFGSDSEFTIRAQNETEVAQQANGAERVASRVRQALTTEFGAGSFRVLREELVGPRVGAELRRNAAIAMLLASLVTLVYLAIRFEWRFGVAAVLSTAHDVLVTLAFIKLLHVEVSLTVVAAILTLLGYSGNDTIIIFDRVRENLKKDRKTPLYDVLNRSINETLPRSI
jgi:preprotein translocase subunit SecF